MMEAQIAVVLTTLSSFAHMRRRQKVHGSIHDQKCVHAAQARLCKAAVLVIGAGGLGCPAALYLAAAGVGRLGIVDQDAVELSNLHRQIAHREASVGMHKADSAAQACSGLNSSIQVCG